MRAILYSDTLRYLRRVTRGIRRFRWKWALVCYCGLAVVGFFVLNWIYQVVRKPVEMLTPISAAFSKSPKSTWQSYGPLFERHSTNILSPEFLAALAQVEGSGNPIARPYWRWQWSWRPFEIYRPASSALGMFQITDGTFVEARKYCIRDHQVLSDGPWYDLNSCWFNSLYSRNIPSHSIEMTAAYLHRSVTHTLNLGWRAKTSVEQKQRLAAVIHLCGSKRGEAFVKHGFRLAAGERCGAHDLRRYLNEVGLMEKKFVRLKQAAAAQD